MNFINRHIVALSEDTMSIINNVKRNDFSEVELAAIPFNILSEAYGDRLAREQLALEHEAFTLGEKRFLKMMERQAESGELADNAAAKPLVATLVPRMANHVQGWLFESFHDINAETGEYTGKRGKRSVSQNMLKEVNPEVAALVTVKVALSRMANSNTDSVSVTRVAVAVGSMLEEELRYGRLRSLEQEHFKKSVEEGLKKRSGKLYKKAFLQVVEKDMLDKGMLQKGTHDSGAWVSWSNADRIQVGVKLLELLIESTGLIKLNRVGAGNGVANDAEMCELADEYMDIISKRAQALAGISPVYQPCVVPPKPWDAIRGGGYWSSGRRPLTLIRVHNKKAMQRYEDVYMPEVYKAVNIAQQTPWKINKNVLAVLNVITKWDNCPVDSVPALERGEKPELSEEVAADAELLKAWKREAAAFYRKDKARVSRRMSLEFMLQQANKFANHKAIYFPQNLDWRGRVYAVPMFNPQGNDMTKGVLTLAKGKPIGKDGFRWLKIHGANCASQKLDTGVKTDKADFDSRVKWVEDNHENILKTAADPLGFTWWSDMDSPFCFLAFCFEYAGVIKKGLGYICSLPIAFDGSCSGIQHFSAMLRDEVGGRAVNLLPSDTVQDIYGIVAARVNEMLLRDSVQGTADEMTTRTDKKTGEIIEFLKLGTNKLAGQWLAFGVDRGVTKRSVMTLAYGSKEYGFRDQVLEDTIRPAIDNGKGLMFTEPTQAAGYMAKLIWESVSVTVVAAVEAMNWLKASAKLLAAEVKGKNKEVLRKACPVHWVTPDGFPVWQEYLNRDQARLNLMFLGEFRMQPQYNTGKDVGINARLQESGIAPNFVHSQDGNHLRMTVVHAYEKYGVESFALIHDSFGTIPADAGSLFKAVRETIVQMYSENDVLADFYEQFADQLHESQLDKMPPLPAKGNLKLEQILESDFAFA